MIRDDGVWRCGRPRTDGKPCRQRLDLAEVSCRLHPDPDASLWRERLWEMHRLGVKAGEEHARRDARAAQAEQARAARFRLTEHGLQVVQIGRYAYVWDGPEPLKLGDRCVLPGNWLFAKQSEGLVTGFGTDYDGELSHIVRLVPA
jgi:hypothetical protein